MIARVLGMAQREAGSGFSAFSPNPFALPSLHQENGPYGMTTI